MIANPKRHQKVMTPDGKGKIYCFEDFRNDYRIGVKHDIFPAHKPRMYKNNVLYYFRKEVSLLA